MSLAGPLFRRRLDGSLPLAVRGAGCWIEDSTGRRYLDAVGGAYTVNLGHGVEEIARAICPRRPASLDPSDERDR